MVFKNFFITFILAFLFSTNCLADDSPNNATSAASKTHLATSTQAQNETTVEKRARKEEEMPRNYFSIAFYKPSYVLPYYYTASPYNAVYTDSTPNNEKLNKSEFKYQLSLKVPVWQNIFNYPSSLYVAYTQLSYWQVYNKTAFFRETDYEPELFLSNEFNLRILNSLKFNFLNIGIVHQSNGFGNELERSWNRLYLELISSTDNWMLRIRPWYVFNDSTTREYNSNIANYLGYGQVVVSYKYGKQVFSFQAHNLIESGAKRATGELTWSFPMSVYINGYIQVFSGYGQSLIEYDHRTNSIGAGIALSNWI